jgi:KDO2-lipid IV(A) lauroyltransferase
VTLLLNSISWLIARLPLRGALALGRGIGRLAALFGRRKQEIIERISDCLGVDRNEAVMIRKNMYKNLGMTAVEFLRQPRMTEAEIKKHIRFEGLEHVPPEGTPALALVSHTGNWELLAAASPLFYPNPLHVVVKALKPESLNDWVTACRSRWGTAIHDRRGSARDLLKILNRGHILAFILDQNAKRNWGVFVDFFGKSACTSDGLSQLAAMKNLPTYPVFCRRLEDHSLVVTIHPPLPPPASREPEAILEHTRQCTLEIESFIRKHPDQWIWMHRRWRTQPETASV